MDFDNGSHGETAEAWNVVARAKYRGEFQTHVELLRSGRHDLLDVEVELLGELLPGADVVHLQCSHGFEGLGLLNAGAASLLGIDASEEMIRQARAKAAALGMETAEFLQSDVVDLPPQLTAIADLVYTGRGSLPWIMDLEGWARSIVRLLRPGGHLFVLEGHPLNELWEREANRLVLRADIGYFDDIPREAPGFPASVVAREVQGDRPRMLERAWRPGQVIEALLSQGLRLELFREFPDLHWDQFPRWPEDLKRRLPHSYVIRGRKPDEA